MNKTWLKIKRGLLEPEHRERMGVRVWLYMYMLDIVDWGTGTIEGWTDKEAADDFGMEFRTLQAQRQQLQADGYITCEQGFQCQRIVIHNWTNPREYSGEVYHPKDEAEDGDIPDVTPPAHGTQNCVPIQTENCVPFITDHIKSTYGLSVPPKFCTIEFSETWSEWEKHRKEIRHTLTKTTVSKQLTFLAKYDLETAFQIIDASILNGWQGLFEPKPPRQIYKNGNGSNGHSTPYERSKAALAEFLEEQQSNE